MARFLDGWIEPTAVRHLILSILPDTRHPQGKTFDWPEDRATALRWIEGCGIRCGLYWTVNVCRPNLMKKARKENVELLRAVWADLDPLDAARAGRPARRPRERTRAAVRARLGTREAPAPAHDRDRQRQRYPADMATRRPARRHRGVPSARSSGWQADRVCARRRREHLER